MDLARLQHIVAVARTSSFSRAAEEVCLTQPALSRSIAAFEARHGIRLFERRRSGVVPTPAGRLVVERAQALLAAARELEAKLGSHASGDAGEVAIGAGQLVASVMLATLGERVLGRGTSLSLRTKIGRRQDLLTDLAEDRIDLLLANPGDPDIQIGFEVHAITHLPLAVLVRGDHPLTQRADVRTADLASWPVAAQISHWPGVDRRAGMMTCEDHFILRDLVLRSDCYTVAARAFVAQELADGRIAALDVADFPLREVEVAVMRRRERTLSPAALVVWQEAVNLLGDFAAIR